MKFSSVIENNSRFYLLTDIKDYQPLNGAIGDIQQSRLHESPGFESCLYEKNTNGLIQEAYAVQYLDDEHIGIYLGAADIYIDFNEAPVDARCKLKTDFFLRVIKKWQEEEEEYKKNPAAYKESIERGEKVFEIEE